MTQKSHSDELVVLWGFCKDLWAHIKKHYHSDMQDDDAVTALIDDTNELSRKYGDNDLCQALILTFLAYKDDWDMSRFDYKRIAKRSEHNEH